MGTATTHNADMIEFVEAVQEWHENRVNQLKLIIDNTDADIRFANQEIEADSDLARGIRTGVKIALSQLGKLPFSTEKTDPEDEEGQDLKD